MRGQNETGSSAHDARAEAAEARVRELEAEVEKLRIVDDHLTILHGAACLAFEHADYGSRERQILGKALGQIDPDAPEAKWAAEEAREKAPTKTRTRRRP